MARLNVNPTRMVLMQCRKKLQTARQGYRMLKEKQDSLIRVFMKHYDYALSLRNQIDEEIHLMHINFGLASLEVDERLLDREMSKQTSPLHIKTKQDSIMGIAVPKFELDLPKSAQNDDTDLIASHHKTDQIRGHYGDMQSKLIELAEVESVCHRLAKEIATTRSRVNALKYKTIPNLEETISYIQLRIDDQVRSQQSRIMKVTK